MPRGRHARLSARITMLEGRREFGKLRWSIERKRGGDEFLLRFLRRISPVKYQWESEGIVTRRRSRIGQILSTCRNVESFINIVTITFFAFTQIWRSRNSYLPSSRITLKLRVKCRWESEKLSRRRLKIVGIEEILFELAIAHESI